MYIDKDDGELTVSATDLVGFLACRSLTWQALAGIGGEGRRDVAEHDPMLALLQQRGIDHERRYLEELRERGHEIAVIDDTADMAARVSATEEALRRGAEVVYQATFLDRMSGVQRRGHADFLTRVDAPSELGAWSYEPEDTKLSTHLNPSAVLQLCSYAEQLAAVQGIDPANVHVVLGGQRRETIRLRDVDAYYRTARQRFAAALAVTDEPYPLPVGHCRVCRFTTACYRRWERDDHLSRVAFLTSDQRRRLEDVGVTTMAALAAMLPSTRVPGISPNVVERLCQQARLQRAAVPGQPPPVELVQPIEAGLGLAALPQPDPGDIFYDIEGHPYRFDGGLEYLHGVATIDTGAFAFDGWWAHTQREEREVFERLIDFIVERRRTYPRLHVYHYAPYETTAVKRMMGRYGTRENEVDNLLRDDVFVDLYRVVRQGVRVGSPSYSIKKLEPLYMRGRVGGIEEGASSIVEYERWLQNGDATILDDILVYNRQDVESLWHLQGWLESQRDELIAVGVDVPRPDDGPDADDAPDDSDDVVLSLLDELTRDLDENIAQPTEDQRTRWLLADLLQWHRREDKPKWWWFFARRDTYEAQDFVDDSECVGGLELIGDVDRTKQSIIWRYRFDAAQEFKASAGDKMFDAALERHNASVPKADRITSSEVVWAVDAEAGTIDLKRSAKRTTHPSNLMPNPTLSNAAQEGSLQRTARRLLDDGIDAGGPSTAALRLVAGRPPHVGGATAGTALRGDDESTLDALVRLTNHLDRSCLPVQGPPGSGKTYSAARAILDLVRQGHRVGITALSHAAIGNLVRAVIEAAGETKGAPVRIVQRSDADKAVTHDWVTAAGSNDDVIAELADGAQIVAGTAWLFARGDMEASVHTLFIDEAGQFSLANAVAVAPSAENVVLVGDPQQLAQPSQGVHPPGAGVSALEHVIGLERTMPPELGLLLDTTWRMHPDVCRFISEQVYEDKLVSVDRAARQRIVRDDVLSGAGLRWVPVPHEGNATSSAEEVTRVAGLYTELIGSPWIDHEGTQRPLDPDEILVVAPYNAQVRALADALPTGARVGTVDKFQGQEAAVVIVSLAASSAEDVPRGMEFLYSRNRMNVAVSRAKVLSIVVASPTLLAVECRSVEQLQLANVLCRFVELATTVGVTGPSST